MGYTTEFEGKFEVTPTLKPEHRMYLSALSESRRMKRSAHLAATLPDPVRVAANLPVGEEGQYYVGGEDYSVIDYNKPPIGQPELWNQWIPTEDGSAIVWDGNEKFHEYTAWLRYIIDHFLKPWGYIVNGTVHYSGEECSDSGTITVTNNEVKFH